MTRCDAADGRLPGASRDPAPTLATLRVEIDRIDAALHGLLMERGEIIDRLIAVKARGGGGSAFRPGREAEMMRRLVLRHAGILPLDTVEGIWRIIISTFTYVQAPYCVHADMAAGDAAMRDSCRFHFGFTVRTHGGSGAVIAAVAAAAGDLGLVPAECSPPRAWWDVLRDPAAPKVIARLPFVERADHAAGLPLFVVARPLAEAFGDIVLYALDDHDAPPWNGSAGVVAEAGAKRLVAAPGTTDAEQLASALGVPRSALAWVGSHARRFDVDSPAAP